jgi:hypothetical protein
MAEVVGALILSAAGAGSVGGIAGLGTVAGTTIAGVSLASVVGATAIIGVSIGLQYALNKPAVPRPEDGSQAVKQSVPPRIRGYGTNRLSGYYMLFESGGVPPAASFDVVAFHSGPITSIGNIYLSDDPVFLNIDINSGGAATVIATGAGDQRYVNACVIEARLGAASQAALSMASDPRISAIWTTAHRGDGIAYVGLSCAGTNDATAFTKIYPRNKPEISVVANCSPCFDPRDGGTRYTANPVIQLIDYLTRVDGGMGLDYNSAIAPNLAQWIDEANICDTLVANASGGTEPRYRSHGWFEFGNAPEKVIGSLLATCDGWLAEAGDGSLSLTTGFYREPTEPPLTEKHITGFALNYGMADEELVNQLDITFTDPASRYVSVQTAPWRDEDMISEAGIVRAKAMDLTWVQSNSQARRLADRAMQRLNALMTGSFTTTLYGLRYLGRRWVKLQYPFISGLQDCVVEIQGAEIDLLGGKIVWQFLRILPDFIEAYDPETDEGAPPVVPPISNTAALLREDGSFYIRQDASTYIREDV